MKFNKIYSTMIGLSAFAFALGLNFKYASNDYGIVDNTLSVHVLAQSDSSSGDDSGDSSGDNSGGSSGGSSNSDVLWTRDDGDCYYKIEGKAGSTVSICGIPIKVNAQGYAAYTYEGGKTDCSSGGNEQCTARYCPPLF